MGLGGAFVAGFFLTAEDAECAEEWDRSGRGIFLGGSRVVG